MKIDGVSQKQQDVLLLLIQGYNQRETAEMLGISLETVEQRLARFRKAKPELAKGFDAEIKKQHQFKRNAIKPRLCPNMDIDPRKVKEKW